MNAERIIEALADALAEEGLAIVPIEATEDMLEAAGEWGQQAPMLCRRIYRAMVSAAQKETLPVAESYDSKSLRERAARMSKMRRELNHED